MPPAMPASTAFAAPAPVHARTAWVSSSSSGTHRRPALPVSAPRANAILRASATSPSAITAPDLFSADEERRLRIGIIGAGRIGQVHADNITFKLRNATLAGVQSGSRVLAERCSLAHGCRPYYDYHELLDNPDVDAVAICSASDRHTEQIIAAAEAGKHIFCEKPIDLDLAEIDKALVAVRKAGVKLQVGFNRRFDQNYARVRKAVVAGEIGNVSYLPARIPEGNARCTLSRSIQCGVRDSPVQLIATRSAVTALSRKGDRGF
jgi:hypothetical protein